MDTQIIGWKRGGYRFSNEGFGTQRCWIREAKTEDGADNNPDEDDFQKLAETEQMELPFH